MCHTGAGPGSDLSNRAGLGHDGVVRVSLTFDNGPTPGVTEHVLEVLDRRNLRATFFVIGSNLRAPGGRALAEAAAAAGHWIGNHTLDHEASLGSIADPGEVRRQIDEAQALLGGLAHPDRLFRPSGVGVIGPEMLGPVGIAHLRRGGFTCVLWNVLPGDWLDPDGWVDGGVAEVAARDWSVVVLHDVPAAALPGLAEFLDRIEAMGAEVTQELPDSCVPIRRGEPTSSFPLLGASPG
jgi:peptidoglycan/xylan/chitin deacetylase (PgdA/CDA1 family)